MPRPDPRAEPESLPPVGAARSAPDHSVERVVVSKIDAKDSASSEGPIAAEPKSEPRPITSDDPRVAELEPLVERNDWKLVTSKLGAIDEAGKLPPNLGLVAAIAHNEMAKDGSPEARDLAVRCMAALLNIPAESELARVIARRLLRKNPVSFRQRPAPPAKTSAFIIVVVLVVGGALGWFLSSPVFTRLLHR